MDILNPDQYSITDIPELPIENNSTITWNSTSFRKERNKLKDLFIQPGTKKKVYILPDYEESMEEKKYARHELQRKIPDINKWGVTHSVGVDIKTSDPFNYAKNDPRSRFKPLKYTGCTETYDVKNMASSRLGYFRNSLKTQDPLFLDRRRLNQHPFQTPDGANIGNIEPYKIKNPRQHEYKYIDNSMGAKTKHDIKINDKISGKIEINELLNGIKTLPKQIKKSYQVNSLLNYVNSISKEPIYETLKKIGIENNPKIISDLKGKITEMSQTPLIMENMSNKNYKNLEVRKGQDITFSEIQETKNKKIKRNVKLPLDPSGEQIYLGERKYENDIKIKEKISPKLKIIENFTIPCDYTLNIESLKGLIEIKNIIKDIIDPIEIRNRGDYDFNELVNQNIDVKNFSKINQIKTMNKADYDIIELLNQNIDIKKLYKINETINVIFKNIENPEIVTIKQEKLKNYIKHLPGLNLHGKVNILGKEIQKSISSLKKLASNFILPYKRQEMRQDFNVNSNIQNSHLNIYEPSKTGVTLDNNINVKKNKIIPSFMKVNNSRFF